MNQKQLVEASRQLLALVDDPHPGLVAWNEACGEAVTKIKAAFHEDTEDDNPSNMLVRSGYLLGLAAKLTGKHHEEDREMLQQAARSLQYAAKALRDREGT